MSVELKNIIIDANNRGGTCDLFAERLSGWRKDREMSRRISPKAPRDKERIMLEFARQDQFTTGIVVQGNLCGYVSIHNIDPAKNSAEITIMIGDKNLWGAGIGAEAVENTLKMFGNLKPENENMLIHAFIRKTNKASWKMFQRLGFQEYFSLDSLPEGYHLHLNDRLFRRKITIY